MDHPASLPLRVYLLAVDPTKERLGSRSELGRALRAAALDQLAREGLLSDERGKATVAGDPSTDPFLDLVLAQVRDARPRTWKAWVGKDERRARTAVQEQALAAGLLRVEPHKVLGLFANDRVSVRDHVRLNDLRTRTTRALTGSEPVSRLDPDVAALAAIAVLAKFRTVADGRTRLRHRARVKELIAAGSPALRALKKSLDDQASAGATAATG